MSDQNKLEVLRAVSDSASIGKPERFSFSALTKNLNLSKEDLDALLTELQKNRFVSQYSKKGVDGFTVVLNQKGIDAVAGRVFWLSFTIFSHFVSSA